MEDSPASAADKLLQQHHSSLSSKPAAAVAATFTGKPDTPATTAGSTSAAVGAAAAAASDAELERMMQAARWGGGGQQQQQQQQPVAPPTAPAGGAAVPRMQQQPLSPVILPAREARQPDIVRHEVRRRHNWRPPCVRRRPACCLIGHRRRGFSATSRSVLRANPFAGCQVFGAPVTLAYKCDMSFPPFAGVSEYLDDMTNTEGRQTDRHGGKRNWRRWTSLLSWALTTSGW